MSERRREVVQGAKGDGEIEVEEGGGKVVQIEHGRSERDGLYSKVSERRREMIDMLKGIVFVKREVSDGRGEAVNKTDPMLA